MKRVAAFAALLTLSGCLVGPDYERPPPATPPTLEFKETLPGWAGEWRMRWRGLDYAWRISGVNFDEAFRDIMRGVARVASGHGAPD